MRAPDDEISPDTNQSKKQVLLVVPPYHALSTPALSISLLKALLAREGITSDVLYLNLLFGEFAGRTLYDRLASNARSLVGDWVFAPILFEATPPAQDFVEHVLDEQLGLSVNEIDQIKSLREAAHDFLSQVIERLRPERYTLAIACADLAVGEDRIQNCPALAFLKSVKLYSASTMSVLCGANCQGPMGAALHRLFPFLDYVGTGEPERIVPDLTQRLLAGNDTPGIPGVFSRGYPNRSEFVPVFPMVRKLDDLPYPNYDDFFEQREAVTIQPPAEPMLLFEASRGCWWGEKHHCTFCGLNGAGMLYRSKSPERALNELDALVNRYQVNSVFATDMILDPKYFGTLLKRLGERVRPPGIFFETKANLSKEQLRVLARAGVRDFQPGVESLSSATLHLMDKGVTALQNVRLLKWCREIGLNPFWNILYGFPHEDPLEYRRIAELIPSLVHLPAPYKVIQIRMDRFSPNFDQAEQRGFRNVRPVLSYKLTYSLSESDLSQIAYYFDYDYADGRDPHEYTSAMRQAVADWKAEVTAPRFEYRHDGESLIIEDSRSVAVRPITVLDGPARTAYLALDAGATVAGTQRALSRSLNTAAPDLGTVERWLEQWLHERLIMRDGSMYLSLAVDPCQRIPTSAERFSAIMSQALRSSQADGR